MADHQIAQQYPILEYDPDPYAIIEPSDHFTSELPEHCVICFFRDVIEHWEEQGFISKIKALHSEMGDHPVYAHRRGDVTVALLQQGVGAPLAAGLLEEVIALGGRKFIACGGAGVLDRTIAMGHLLVPTSAVRDEGASYHYLPPSREVAPSPGAVAAIETVLKRRHIDYLLVKTWTTDAYYRETRAKAALRRSEGCLAVEMEAAAMFAVARFRNVQFGQILYGGDNLDSDVWDSRDWDEHWTVREKLVELSIEACLEL